MRRSAVGPVHAGLDLGFPQHCGLMYARGEQFEPLMLTIAAEMSPSVSRAKVWTASASARLVTMPGRPGYVRIGRSLGARVGRPGTVCARRRGAIIGMDVRPGSGWPKAGGGLDPAPPSSGAGLDGWRWRWRRRGMLTDSGGRPPLWGGRRLGPTSGR